MSDSTALQVVQPPAGALQEWTPRFTLAVDEAVELVDQKREFYLRVMRDGEHFGVIPGAGKKKVLLKPGAELLLSSMGLRADVAEDASPPVIDLMGSEEHGGEPYIQFDKICTIYRQTGPDAGDRMVIARATGSCNSWERKYRYRRAERTCPSCGKAAIIKGKQEYGGGWLCHDKRGGCKAKFLDQDQRIIGQVVGEIKNPDPADVLNTVEKMAAKRALVAATLIATGCSDVFTQDMEDGLQSPDHEQNARDDEDPGGHAAGTKPEPRSQATQGRPAAASTTATAGGAELEALNDLLPEPVRWSPNVLKAKLTHPKPEIPREEMRKLHELRCPGCTHYGGAPTPAPASGPPPPPPQVPDDPDRKLEMKELAELKQRLGIDDRDDGSLVWWKGLVGDAFAAFGEPANRASMVNLRVKHARWLRENAAVEGQFTVTSEAS